MPKLTNSVPKYRKHKQSGQAIVTINRRDYLLGPHGTAASKREYDRLITEWLSAGRSAAYGVAAEQYTVVELVVDYLTHAKEYYGGGTRSTYATMVRVCRPLRRLYSRLPAEDFRVLQFKALRQQLVDRNLSRNYINETMRRVVAVFRWGAAEGRLPASVPANLAAIPGLRKGRGGVRETNPVKPVDAAIVEATIPHLPLIVADMVRLQMLTGARPGEICRLRPCDVDRSTSDVWEARLHEHKTAHYGCERIVYIGPQAQDVLRPYLLRPAGQFCFSPAESMEQMRRAQFRQDHSGELRQPPRNQSTSPAQTQGRGAIQHTELWRGD